MTMKQALYSTRTAGVAVIHQQPFAFQDINTTIVVNQQPTGWSSGLCSCCDDMRSCCCVWWVGSCYYACIANRMNESGCVGCCGHPAGCVPGGHLAMRAAFRNKHGIAGDICSDCVAVTWCLPCVMCQLSREMDVKGYPRDGCC